MIQYKADSERVHERGIGPYTLPLVSMQKSPFAESWRKKEYTEYIKQIMIRDESRNAKIKRIGGKKECVSAKNQILRTFLYHVIK